MTTRSTRKAQRLFREAQREYDAAFVSLMNARNRIMACIGEVQMLQVKDALKQSKRIATKPPA
ncbi:MAG TPA: hypothetical protein VFW94_23400 [Candidatus Acidoferrales bacterium]|nr:hypothetical protein [Candidatus Acidoferrales bacterium]